MKALKAWLLAGVALAACATMGPPAEELLAQARASFQAAEADPHVKKFAVNELDQARRELSEAERLWKQGSGNDKVAHQAYLAQQRARIARELAIARAGDVEVQQAAERRNQAVMEARLREAEQKRQEAEALARESQAKLAAADKARAAESTQRSAEVQRSGEAQRFQSQLAALQAKQTDRGWVLTLGADMFEPGAATLRPEGKRAAGELATVLRDHPQRNVVIEGFDNSGGEATNRWVSERRAQGVRDVLVVAGVAPSRINTRGLGSTSPVARVEIVIPEGGAATGR